VDDKKEIKFSRGDFIAEKKEKFKDYYDFGRCIGKGDLGEVRVCCNRSTRAVRAVKILKKEALQGEERFRFLYEIEIMKKLDHPNILRLFEIFYDDKRYYLVTELCTGGELYNEILQKGKFSEKEAAIILKQVLEAISY
jgi:calcium-dependent protein kinase